MADSDRETEKSKVINQTEFVVRRARESAIYVRGLAAGLQDMELASAAVALLSLCDEVERLRDLADKFAFEEGDDFAGRVDSLRVFHGEDR